MQQRYEETGGKEGQESRDSGEERQQRPLEIDGQDYERTKTVSGDVGRSTFCCEAETKPAREDVRRHATCRGKGSGVFLGSGVGLLRFDRVDFDD